MDGYWVSAQCQVAASVGSRWKLSHIRDQADFQKSPEGLLGNPRVWAIADCAPSVRPGSIPGGRG